MHPMLVHCKEAGRGHFARSIGIEHEENDVRSYQDRR
jgi:hypothetical protein